MGDSLSCDHCGDDAIESPDGLFGDGDGEACMSCGFPGWVAVDGDDYDEDASVHWQLSDDDAAVCRDLGCDSCAPHRARPLCPGEGGGAS